MRNAKKDRLLTPIVVGTLLLELATFTVAIWVTGTYAWDDGAITIAFARTLASEGKFALTSASAVVEGSSSLLYTFVLALGLCVWPSAFLEQIRLAQLLSLFFMVLTLVSLDCALCGCLVSRYQRWLLLGLFALIPMHLAEMLNGMEMTMFAYLLTTFVREFERRSVRAWVFVPFLLLTRFESIFYLGFALMGHSVFGGKDWRYPVKTLLVVIGAFLILTAGRWGYFEDFIPNTVWAKTHVPYTARRGPLDALSSHFWALYLFVRSNAGFILAGPVLAIAIGPRRLLGDVKAWLIAAFACFALATGASKGYPQRLYTGALPLFLMLAVQQCSAVEWSKVRVGRLSLSNLRPLFLIPALSVVFGFATNASLARANLSTIAAGAFYQGRVSAAALQRAGFRFPEKHFGVTPETYRQTGVSFDRLRTLLGLQTIKVMAPDVGGLGLCCDGDSLEVLDSALLTNPVLGRAGYSGFSAYVERQLPDVIETHGIWSKVSRVYELEVFRLQYRPIVFEGSLFWLRRDLLKSLHTSPLVHMVKVRDWPEIEGVRYFSDRIQDHEVDRKYLATVNEILLVTVVSAS